MAGFPHAMAWSVSIQRQFDGVDGEFVEDTQHAGGDAIGQPSPFPPPPISLT
jgi:hypothetical protein